MKLSTLLLLYSISLFKIDSKVTSLTYCFFLYIVYKTENTVKMPIAAQKQIYILVLYFSTTL